MNPANAAMLAGIMSRINAVAVGAVVPPLLMDPEADSELRRIGQGVNSLIEHFAVLREFSIALANGCIDFEVPPRQHLLDPLKSLQSSLKHLTWQTQEVAAGHLDHRVEFLGEFSVAFNRMVEALREKERAEREAIQSGRLVSIGQLAAGIAHEINTPIQYIGDNLRYVDRGMTKLGEVLEAARHLANAAGGAPELADAVARFEDAFTAARVDTLVRELPAAIGESLDGVTQISRIVLSMKEFSHPGTVARTTSDLNHALENTLIVSHNAWKQCVVIERDFFADLPGVLCHPGEINQVFLNLILNAAQAVESSGKALPGHIRLTTRQDGDWVEIRVADTGMGVPLHLREKIFEPFFTTKPVGKGTGQGLAICRHVVVARHGGTLEVQGAEGEGAVFVIRLPIANEMDADELGDME